MTTITEDRKRLKAIHKKEFIELMKEHNLAKYQPDNPFTLASGAVSPWYFDVKSALMFDPTRRLIADMLDIELAEVEASGGLPPLVGGPANAAYLLVGIQRRTRRSFVLRKAEKDHGIVGKIDGWPAQSGDRVVLVEDVITTGGSLLPCIRYVESRGAEVIEIIVVVDRNENDQLGKYREQGLVHALTTKEDFLQEGKLHK